MTVRPWCRAISIVSLVLATLNADALGAQSVERVAINKPSVKQPAVPGGIGTSLPVVNKVPAPRTESTETQDSSLANAITAPSLTAAKQKTSSSAQVDSYPIPYIPASVINGKRSTGKTRGK